MKGHLKCAKCLNHSARKYWGFNEKRGQLYHYKHCLSCGYDTPKVYYGRVMTKEEYDKLTK